MPIPVTCPGCSAKMKAPDAAIGKKVKCPKCQQAITVSAPEPVDDFEVVEDEPAPAKKPTPAPAAKPKAKAVEVDDDEEDEKPRKKPAKAVAEEDEDEDEKPRKKKAVAAEADDDDEDEDEDKPRKKKAKAAKDDDEDEDEDKPRKKKKKRRSEDDDDEEKKGVSMVRNIIMGVVLIILLGVVAFVYWQKFGNNDDKSSSNTPSGDPPAGPSGPPGPPPVGPVGLPGPKQPGPGGNPPIAGKGYALKSTAGKFSVEMPGKPEETVGQTGKGKQKFEFMLDLKDRVFMVVYADTPGASQGRDTILNGLPNVLSQGGRLISAEKITLGPKQHSGREIVFEKPEKVFSRGRYFVVGDRLYQAVAAGTEEFIKSKPVEVFLNSFVVED